MTTPEVFLPYDVEFTFGAALHLTMANAVFPGVVDYQWCRQLSDSIFDDLIARGNRVARARRAELYHVETLCQELAAQVQQQGHQTLTLSYVDAMNPEFMRRMNEEQEGVLAGDDQAMYADHGEGMHAMTNMEFLDSVGISSGDFMSIVSQIGDPETIPESMLMLD